MLFGFCISFYNINLFKIEMKNKYSKYELKKNIIKIKIIIYGLKGFFFLEFVNFLKCFILIVLK